MILARRTLTYPAATGRVALVGVEAVGLGVERVVQEVGAAGREAERDERDECGREVVGLAEHAGGAGRGEHEQVLDPLLGSGGGEQAEGERRRASTPGCARLRCRDRPLGGYGHRSQSIGIDLVSSVVMTSSPRRVYTRTGDDGTTGLLLRRPGPEGHRRPGGLRRRRRGGRRRSAWPGPATERDSELDRLLVRLQRELFVVGAELATEPAEPREARARRLARHRRDGRARSSRSSTTSAAASTRRRSSCCRARTAVAAALDLARTVVRRAERASRGGRTRRAGWPTATSSPT